MAEQSDYTGRLPSGECIRVTVRGETISAVEPVDDDRSLPYLLPVLVDLQHNRSLGIPYNALEIEGAEPLAGTARMLRCHGVGRCLATLTTYDYDGLLRSAAIINKTLEGDPDLATLFFGILHEGVFISPLEGWRGVHPTRWIRDPDYALFDRLDDASGRRVRIVNIAPELPGAMAFIEKAVAAGKIVALGHCAPTPDDVREAVARGASTVTHLGNGAPTLVHRFRNPFWSFLNAPELATGLICDGFHLPKDLVGTALRCKGRERCLPVSDASWYSGCTPGPYRTADGQDFVIEDSGHIHLTGSETMCGNWFQQDRCVEFLTRDVGVPFLDAWEQCSSIPAAFIGERLPQVAGGEEASFVLARWDDGLVLEQSVHLGRPYLTRPMRPVDLPDPC